MAGYSLQISQDPFKNGKNILASEHVQFIEGGATIVSGQGVLDCGTAIARRSADKLWEKYASANVANYDDYGILNVNIDATSANVVVGEVIIRGSVYDAKLVGVDATFKGKVPNIRFVN